MRPRRGRGVVYAWFRRGLALSRDDSYVVQTWSGRGLDVVKMRSRRRLSVVQAWLRRGQDAAEALANRRLGVV